ncbi:hypothetical protein [Xanthomonas euvesicatoria]|uniref:hypothetical protein n=1 Tax=Xanthomonas euvesicatoria TaxID=456327 RepID=UPI001056EA3C|nr:hypothetical protein [Xanthomonas euvesicatoria]MCC8912967.1 hypothetical protein [Xanthomonas euvesicatoria]
MTLSGYRSVLMRSFLTAAGCHGRTRLSHAPSLASISSFFKAFAVKGCLSRVEAPGSSDSILCRFLGGRPSGCCVPLLLAAA